MRPAGVRLVLAYGSFAAAATVANLIVQALLLELLPRALPGIQRPVFPALVCGTAAGLVVKYVLDKRYIFIDQSQGIAMHARKFSLYSAMGLVTTAIAWASELVALHFDPNGFLVYVGGAAGLALGYVVKYNLDRRFVFVSAA